MKNKIIFPGEALIDIFKINNKIEKKVGGAPLNVSVAASQLDVDTYFLGTIGHDINGKRIIDVFKKYKLHTNFVSYSQLNTTTANVFIDKQGERDFTFIRGADQDLKYSDEIKNLIDKSYIIHMGSATAFLGGGLLNTYKKILKLAVKKNKILFFDPNYRKDLYSSTKKHFIKKCEYFIMNSDAVKLSFDELQLITTKSKLEAGIKYLWDLYPNKLFLITLGQAGVLIRSNFHNEIIKSINVTQVDSTGAGDAFIGYLIGQVAEKELSKYDLINKSLKQLIIKSNICAALTVTKIGALDSIPSKIEVEKTYKEIYETKIVS